MRPVVPVLKHATSAYVRSERASRATTRGECGADVMTGRGSRRVAWVSVSTSWSGAVGEKAHARRVCLLSLVSHSAGFLRSVALTDEQCVASEPVLFRGR